MKLVLSVAVVLASLFIDYVNAGVSFIFSPSNPIIKEHDTVITIQGAGESCNLKDNKGGRATATFVCSGETIHSSTINDLGSADTTIQLQIKANTLPEKNNCEIHVSSFSVFSSLHTGFSC